MHSDYSPTSSLISLPYCLHPPHSLRVPLPSSCLWLFCDPLTLTRAMWVTTTLKLSTGAWWGHKWVCRGRQWPLVSPDLSVANSWAVRTEAPEALLHPCLVVTVPFSCQFSVDISSFSEFVIAAVASLTEDCTSQPFPIVQASRPFLSLARAAPRALGAAV